LNVQVSYIHWFSAWIAAWVSSGSSRIRSSTRLARVGNMRARIDALLVHQLDARRRLAVRRDRADRVAEDRPPVLAVGVAVAEVLLHRPGRGHHVERRVGM
jgi:predicted aspartyl protease